MIAFDLIKSLFSRGVGAAELKEKVRDLDREKRELRYDQRRLDKQRAESFERTKAARLRGDNAEVVYHLQEMKGLDTENRALLRDLSRLNKALIVLGHYQRRLERLERRRDVTQITKFIERFRASPAMAGIEEASMSEEMLQDLLDEELGEIDRELGMVGDFGQLDDQMKEMLDAVDAVIEAERSGDDDAIRRVKTGLAIGAAEDEAADAARPAAESEPAKLTEGEEE